MPNMPRIGNCLVCAGSPLGKYHKDCNVQYTALRERMEELGTVYLVCVSGPDHSEVVAVLSSNDAAVESKDWINTQLDSDGLDKAHVIKFVVNGKDGRGMWRVWIDLEGKVDGDPSYWAGNHEPPKAYQMSKSGGGSEVVGWAATGRTREEAYALARTALRETVDA